MPTNERIDELDEKYLASFWRHAQEAEKPLTANYPPRMAAERLPGLAAYLSYRAAYKQNEVLIQQEQLLQALKQILAKQGSS